MKEVIEWLKAHGIDCQITADKVIWETNCSIGIYDKNTNEIEWREKRTIEEIKEMPRNDGWGKPRTIGEAEGWSGQVENW